MPSDPCREDFRPMSKETFLQTMERFWMRIQVEDQGFGGIEVTFRDGLLNLKSSSNIRGTIPTH